MKNLSVAAILLCLLIGCGDSDSGAESDDTPEADANNTPDENNEDENNEDENNAPTPDPEPTPDPLPEPSPEVDPGPEVDPLDFDQIGAPTLVQGRFGFTEGPAWDVAGGRLLFTDIPREKVHSLTLPDTVEDFIEESGGANGLVFDTQGRLIVAGHASRNVVRIDAEGTREVLAETFDGKRFNSPNDVAVRDDDTIYFTDPTFGLGDDETSEFDFMGLFRIDPSGTVHLEAELDNSPNGTALSPDHKTLYVTITFGNALLAYDVADDGSLSGEVKIASPAFPDGMAVDTGGNLYVTAATGVVVYDSEGVEIGTVSVPEQPANCAFGGPAGDILFITARRGLYMVEGMPITGF